MKPHLQDFRYLGILRYNIKIGGRGQGRVGSCGVCEATCKTLKRLSKEKSLSHLFLPGMDPGLWLSVK